MNKMKPTYEDLERRIEELEEEAAERSSVESALRIERDRAQMYLDIAEVMFLAVDNEGKVTLVNKKGCEILGYHEEEILGKSWFDHFLTRPDREAVKAVFQRLLKGETAPLEYFTNRVLTKKGEERTILWHNTLLRNEKGEVIGTFSSGIDITDRIHAEKALRESEEKYRLLVENATDAIFIAQDEVIKFPNPRAKEMIGYSTEELSGIRFVDLIHPEDRNTVIERHQRRLKGEVAPSTYSFRIMPKEGEAIWAELSTVLITWEGKPATLNIVRDITHQKNMEDQLLHAQKMEAIGTLAGGIAHDFNNLLMGIQGWTSLMLMETDSSHPHFEHLKGIEAYIKSASDLTRQLLGFARRGKYEGRPADLNALVKATSEIFCRTRKEIVIRSSYEERLWLTEVDRRQIEQVLLNLYLNALQSMDPGGELSLETRNILFDKSDILPYGMTPGRYVRISVSDTGRGMDEETAKRIFEPFFTTRAMGRGTGLSLASAYGIIKNHGGIIEVSSRLGLGTRFNIYLPASNKEVVNLEESVNEVVHGKITILLIDDEVMILEVGQKILSALGYGVLTARSGKEALRVFMGNKETIAMVILDLVMPDTNTAEIYDRFKEINPGIKVLLSSGYSMDVQASAIMERGCNGFIQKPFRMKDLSQKMRDILEASEDQGELPH